jgi:unsaturated rhamnogalacturonyl hydrolase
MSGQDTDLIMDNVIKPPEEISALIDLVARRTMQMDLAWDWPAGVAYHGLARAWAATGRQEYLDFLVQWTDERLKNGLTRLTVNAVSLGHLMLALADATGDERYLRTAGEMAVYLTKDAVRFGEGVLQHTVSQNYSFPEQAWADTLFMAALFLLKYGVRQKQPVHVADALNQYYWHEEFLQDHATNLYYHAWDNLAQNHLSGVPWARANAWAALTAADALRQIDAMNPAFMRIADSLRDQLAALVRRQTPAGLWTTVLTDPASYEETSASAGIGAALVIFQRVFRYDLYAAPIARTLAGVRQNVAADGTVKNVSAGTAVMPDAAAYHAVPKKRIQGWGQGLTLAFLAELLGKQNPAPCT